MIGCFEPSHLYSPVETLFLLRPVPPEEELRESNILANTSLWNVVAGIVNRAASREQVSVVKATVPQIPCAKGLGSI